MLYNQNVLKTVDCYMALYKCSEIIVELYITDDTKYEV